MLLSLLCGLALAASPVVTAGHHGTWAADTLSWESTFVLDPTGEARVALAVPLPPGARVTGASPAAAVPEYDATGAIVALVLDHAVGRETVTVTQPAAPGPIVLRAPLAEGSAVQRVTLTGAEFVPDPGLGVDRRLTDARQAGVSRAQRREVSKALGRARPADRPMYVVADVRVRDAGGLAGTLAPSGRREAAAASVIGVAFAGVIGALLLARKILARRLEAEAVDAYIAREFVGVDQKAKGAAPPPV